MSFCSKCGNALTDTKKFCTKCGTPNLFYKENVLPDLEKAKKEKEEQERAENEKRLLEYLQLRQKEEEEMKLAEKERQEQLEREKREYERREQERLERERLQAMYEQQRKEELVRKLFETEKSNTLDQIRFEREKLKEELESLQRLKMQAQPKADTTPAKPRRGVVRRTFEVLLFVVFIAGIGAAGSYLYTVYMGSNSFELAQNCINRQEWPAAAGYLSKSLDEYNAGKLAVSGSEATNMKVWCNAAKQFAVWVPELRGKVHNVHTLTEYNAVNGKFSAIDWQQLSTAYLPHTDVHLAVSSVTRSLDSMNLLALQGFLTDTGKLMHENGCVWYKEGVSKMNIDTALAGIFNKNDNSISGLYENAGKQHKELLPYLSTKANTKAALTETPTGRKPARTYVPKAAVPDAEPVRVQKRNAD